MTEHAKPEHQALRALSLHNLLAWLAITLLLYPLYAGCGLLIDTFMGPQLFITQLQFESKSALLRILIMDGLHALPWAAGLGVIVILVLHFSPRPIWGAMGLGTTSGLLIGLLLGAWAGVAIGLSTMLASYCGQRIREC